jgi:hypothetical protein
VIVWPYSSQSPPTWLLIESTHYTREGGKHLNVVALSAAGPAVPVMVVRNVLFAACTVMCLCAALRNRKV